LLLWLCGLYLETEGWLKKVLSSSQLEILRTEICRFYDGDLHRHQYCEKAPFESLSWK
jgi:hypothetical protein